MDRLILGIATALAFGALVSPTAAHGTHATDPSETLEPGTSLSITFEKAGGFGYHCAPHPWMRGNVTIGPAGPALRTWHVAIVEPSDPNGWGYDPAELQIGVGDTVVFHNNATIMHTVTPNPKPKAAPEETPEEPSGSPGVGVLSLLGGATLAAAAWRRR